MERKSFRNTGSSGADGTGDGGLFKGSRHAVHVSERTASVTRAEVGADISLETPRYSEGD